jgi:type VI secretion system protein ImpM
VREVSEPSIGVYGKVRAQGDFLRHGTGDFSQAGLDRWLEEAMGVLSTERATLPEGAAGFLLAPAGGTRAFVGAVAPSEDSVGRKFPLLVFVELPAAAAGAFPVVPTMYARFVHAASDLVLAGGDLPAPELLARAKTLAGLAPSVPRGDEIADLANEPALPLRDACGGSAADLAYALRTFGLACDQALKAPGAGLTVDAPARSAAARELWLDIARRRCGRRAAFTPAATFWTDGAAGHLLVALGAPAPAMLAFLANPRHRSRRLWPLRTEVPEAASQAINALTPAQRRCVEDADASLAALVAEFA